jgi:hypothetical protein
MRARFLRDPLYLIPLGLWAAHVALAVFVLPSLTGEGKFITAGWFFMLSGACMLVLAFIAAGRLGKQPGWYNSGALFLNFTWLYYVKVMLSGPTIGMF